MVWIIAQGCPAGKRDIPRGFPRYRDLTQSGKQHIPAGICPPERRQRRTQIPSRSFPVPKQQIDSTRRQSAPNAALNYQAHIPHPAAAPFPDSRMHSRAYVTCIVPQTSSRTLTGSIPNSKTIPRMVSTIQNPIQARVVTI